MRRLPRVNRTGAINPETWNLEQIKDEEVQSVIWVNNTEGSRTAILTTVTGILVKVIITSVNVSNTKNTVTTVVAILRA